MHWNVVPWFSREGRPLGKFGIFRDITEQKRSERRIAETLEERELLLKEIHHRVRTNMQVICSLLNLHSNSVHDEGSRKILRDSQDRIRSMALAHETLYHAPDFCHIDFGQYADGLCRSLLRAYEATQIRVEVVAQGIFVTLDTAVHLGLILNEIISNALKHAFPLGRPGLIRIGMNTEGGTTHLLLVQDDGVGLPDSVDCRNPDSLGLQIIATMVEQLQGSLRVDVDHGTAYRMKLHIQPHQA